MIAVPPMTTANHNAGAWSRKVWVWVVALTAIGLAGAVVDFFGGIYADGGRIGTGCGGGIGILLLVYFGLALIWGFVCVLASVGAFLLWRRSRWGPLLLIPVDLLCMYVIGSYQSVFPGQLIWGGVVVLLATAPAVAAGLLVWLLWTRGRLWVRVLELVILGAIAVPLLWTYPSGLSSDVSSALQPAPPRVAATGCGGGSAGLPPVVVAP